MGQDGTSCHVSIAHLMLTIRNKSMQVKDSMAYYVYDSPLSVDSVSISWHQCQDKVTGIEY
ncbi:hypothetical protein PILCRDRAFT_518980 [Piloderma croceum F 1598]|uniref:Uncharacterized protein n=1 Tax=Piloderma croceum (strain F 1598) TaxID=765440 RepID=A0A0C3BU10_PILCF|nr:hypothetical protein PILCRDRAFT_518980 [Piloderma croceum F 1598]